MAEITAQKVNELRNKTGLGMMECKKALTEAGGDVDKAVENLRKKGVKTSIMERAATEGRVAASVSPDSKHAAAVEVVCNTDFTAKSDPVARIADLALQQLLSQGGTGGNLAEDGRIKSELTAVAQQTGENVQLGRTARLDAPANGSVGSYLYTTAGKGKIAVLMALAGTVGQDVLNQVGMHIAAARPIALTRDQVPADLVAKEREIAVEQAKATGKPQQIAEKIAEGKLNAFYAERVLLDQDFINAEVYKGKVGDFLKSKGATLEKYVRIEVGQQ
jgi:elongation factor Ts